MNDGAVSQYYRNWLTDTYVPWSGFSRDSYYQLFFSLDSVQFLWNSRIPLDQNRALDGLELRKRFANYCPEAKDFSGYMEWFETPCSLFEALVALAVRAEREYIGDPSDLNPAPIFWEMMKNAAFIELSDRNFDVKKSDKLMSLLKKNDIFRDFSVFLPLRFRYGDEKNMEIWSRLMKYISENYN